jgi:hypothetical protein
MNLLEVGSDCVRVKQVLVLDIVPFNDEFSVATKNAFRHSSSGAGVSVKPHYKLDIVSLPRPCCFKVLESLRLGDFHVNTVCHRQDKSSVLGWKRLEARSCG